LGGAAPARTAYAVGSYILAAYWFTSSTSFANPAVTIARMFSDTFAGIAPGSVAMFVAMQLLGGAVAYCVIRGLYPNARARAAEVAAGPDAMADSFPGVPATGTPAGHA
jgi:glycerol uptake facilitator-like aquaporin